MSDMFSVIASQMEDEQERLEGNRARIAATQRLEKRFLSYLNKAESSEELEQRVAMIEPHVMKVVEAACAEHRYAHSVKMYEEVMGELRKKAGEEESDCPKCKGKGVTPDTNSEIGPAWDHKPDQLCSECDGDGKVKSARLIKKQAGGATVPTGDTYHTERIDLGASDTGLQDKGSPKIDKNKVPKGGLDPIEVESVRHPLERQSVRDKPDYGNRHDGPEVADPTGGPRKRVDADKPMQPEHHVAPRTDTWSDKGSQAKPITSSFEPHWTVLD